MTKRRHRRHSTAKKREVVEAYLNGEALHAPSKQHDVCRNLIRIWIEKYERGEYDDDAVEADLLPEYEARLPLRHRDRAAHPVARHRNRSSQDRSRTRDPGEHVGAPPPVAVTGDEGRSRRNCARRWSAWPRRPSSGCAGRGWMSAR